MKLAPARFGPTTTASPMRPAPPAARRFATSASKCGATGRPGHRDDIHHLVAGFSPTHPYPAEKHNIYRGRMIACRAEAEKALQLSYFSRVKIPAIRGGSLTARTRPLCEGCGYIFLAKLAPAASLAEKRNSLHRDEHRVKPVFALLQKNTATPAKSRQGIVAC